MTSLIKELCVCLFLFLDPPVIRKLASVVWSFNASDSVAIVCVADANPDAEYVWKKGATEVVRTGSLHLNKLNDSDNGNYTCTATNNLGSDNLTISVRVTSKFQ